MKDTPFYYSFIISVVKHEHLSEALSWCKKIPKEEAEGGEEIILNNKEESENHKTPETIRKFSDNKVNAIIDFWGYEWQG